MAQCLFPYYVENKVYHHQEDRYIPTPCGKCPECTKRRAHSWAFRLQTESENWPFRYFLTLTYDTLSLPISPNGWATLRKKDVQDFMKVIRKHAKVKYYYVGEYGTKRKRPHYHMILLADTKIDDIIIEKWHHGLVHFGKAEEGSIYYTIQYYDKGNWYKFGDNDDRVPEFSNMSKGLGLKQSIIEYISTRHDKPYIYSNGKKIAIPRYYRKKLFEQNPEVEQKFLLSQKLHGKQQKNSEQSTADSYARFEYIRNFRREQRSRRNRD